MFINVNVNHLANRIGVDCKVQQGPVIVYHFNRSLLHFAINVFSSIS